MPRRRARRRAPGRRRASPPGARRGVAPRGRRRRARSTTTLFEDLRQQVTAAKREAERAREDGFAWRGTTRRSPRGGPRSGEDAGGRSPPRWTRRVEKILGARRRRGGVARATLERALAETRAALRERDAALGEAEAFAKRERDAARRARVRGESWVLASAAAAEASRVAKEDAAESRGRSSRRARRRRTGVAARARGCALRERARHVARPPRWRRTPNGRRRGWTEPSARRRRRGGGGRQSGRSGAPAPPPRPSWTPRFQPDAAARSATAEEEARPEARAGAGGVGGEGAPRARRARRDRRAADVMSKSVEMLEDAKARPRRARREPSPPRRREPCRPSTMTPSRPIGSVRFGTTVSEIVPIRREARARETVLAPRAQASRVPSADAAETFFAKKSEKAKKSEPAPFVATWSARDAFRPGKRVDAGRGRREHPGAQVRVRG